MASAVKLFQHAKVEHLLMEVWLREAGSMAVLVHSLAFRSDRNTMPPLAILRCRKDNLHRERNHNVCRSGLPGDYHFGNLDSSQKISTWY
jgi:hypothetical protein